MNRLALEDWAKRVKQNTFALYLAGKHPQVPLIAKLMIGVVVGYALSPVDLIPDFIPVIGYLDDLLLLPLGIWCSIRLIPRDVWQECQREAAEQPPGLPRSRKAAVVVILVWLVAIVVCIRWLWPDPGGAAP